MLLGKNRFEKRTNSEDKGKVVSLEEFPSLDVPQQGEVLYGDHSNLQQTFQPFNKSVKNRKTACSERLSAMNVKSWSLHIRAMYTEQ